MWPGYVTYDDTEIINTARTEAYAGGERWFRPTPRNHATDLPAMLGQTYVSPATDGAPWYDPDIPASADFYGLYPQDVLGLDDGTMTVTPFERTDEGSVPGRVRHAAPSGVFSVVLLARTELGLDHGITWLRRALLGAACSDQLTTQQGLGLELGYLAAKPQLSDDPTDDPTETLVGYRRYRRNVVVSAPPVVVTRRVVGSCSGAVATVTFTLLVGNPRTYGPVQPLLQGYMDPLVADPWVAGAPAGTADSAATAFTDVPCEPALWSPIYDPLCPPLVVPPAPPSVPLACFTPPDIWDRRVVTLPAVTIPLWGQVAPIVTVTAPEDDPIRNLRLRFFPDPDGTLDPDDTPCAWTGEAYISYIPAGAVLELDAANRAVYVTTNTGHRRLATHLVYSGDGLPLQWPVLTCGAQVLLVVDTDPANPVDPILDLALAPVAF